MKETDSWNDEENVIERKKEKGRQILRTCFSNCVTMYKKNIFYLCMCHRSIIDKCVENRISPELN